MEQPDRTAYRLLTKREADGRVFFAWAPRDPRAAAEIAGRIAALTGQENIANCPGKVRNMQESHLIC